MSGAYLAHGALHAPESRHVVKHILQCAKSKHSEKFKRWTLANLRPSCVYELFCSFRSTFLKLSLGWGRRLGGRLHYWWPLTRPIFPLASVFGSYNYKQVFLMRIKWMRTCLCCQLRTDPRDLNMRTLNHSFVSEPLQPWALLWLSFEDDIIKL